MCVRGDCGDFGSPECSSPHPAATLLFVEVAGRSLHLVVVVMLLEYAIALLLEELAIDV